MQILLKVLILFFACGVAMVLLMRLQRLQTRLAELHDELQRNDENMATHRKEMERLGVLQSQGQAPGGAHQNGASPHGEGEIKLQGPGQQT